MAEDNKCHSVYDADGKRKDPDEKLRKFMMFTLIGVTTASALAVVIASVIVSIFFLCKYIFLVELLGPVSFCTSQTLFSQGNQP